MTGLGKKSSRIVLSAVAAIGVTAFCLWLSFSFADGAKIAAAFRSASIEVWAGCFLMSTISGALRFARLKTVYAEAPSLALFNASSLHGAALALLPGRFGEAVLPLALKRMTGTSVLSCVGFLLLVRAFDAVVLIGCGVIAGATFLFHVPPVVAGAIAATGLVAIAGFSFALRLGVFETAPAGGRSLKMLRELTDAAARLSPAQLGLVLAETIGVWGALAASAYIALKGTGLDAEPMQALAAIVAASFAFASPLNGVASAGPFEAAFAGAFAVSGGAFEPALAAAAIVHIAAVAAALAAALVGHALYTAFLGARREKEFA